jgi:rhodanese-related sulfurtransferase
MSVDALARRLASSDPPVLLDTRSENEFDVSHLPGALHVGPNIAGPDIGELIDRARTVVTYCSIGYRSARVAQQLTEMGIKDVHNLEGSIFQWANQGHEVVRNGRAVREVHPFDSTWGVLLKRGLRCTDG